MKLYYTLLLTLCMNLQLLAQDESLTSQTDYQETPQLKTNVVELELQLMLAQIRAVGLATTADQTRDPAKRHAFIWPLRCKLAEIERLKAALERAKSASPARVNSEQSSSDDEQGAAIRT